MYREFVGLLLVIHSGAFTTPLNIGRQGVLLAKFKTTIARPAENVDSLPDAAPVVVVSKDAKFGWDKDRPKKSLENYGQSHTASQFVLNVVEGFHWASFVPAFVSFYAIIKYHDVWLALLDGDPLRLALWCVVALLPVFSGMAPIFAHVYEDWQVAPSVDPMDDDDDNNNNNNGELLYVPTEYTNERLRQVAYSILFTGLGLSSTIEGHAYHGWETSLVPLAISLVLFAYACLGDRNHLVSDYLAPLFAKYDKTGKGLSVLPVPVSSLLFFVYGQIIMLTFALLPLAALVDDIVLKAAILVPPMLQGVGGLIEGFVAEVKFDQRLHLLAIVGLVSSACLQAWSFFQLGAYLS